MNNYFPIQINDIDLKVKKLNFKNYCAAFEIWKKDHIQFILVYNHDKNDNHAWSVDSHECENVNQAYIDQVVAAIDSHYTLVPASTLKPV